MEVLKQDNFLRKVYSTTGECRMHCVGFAPNMRTLESHVNYLFRNTRGIKRLTWQMLLSTIKDVDGGVDEGERSSDH